MKISVSNSNKKFVIDEKVIKRAAAFALGAFGLRNKIDLDIVFLDDGAMRRLNRRYKGADRPTDVLCFELDHGKPGSLSRLGEIFISIDMAVRNSRRFGKMPSEELALYAVHGIAHLAGYDDRTAADSRVMTEKQEDILRQICKREDLLKVLTRR